MGVAEDFAPSFTQKPQLRQEDEGNRLVFECQLLASPKPEIDWFRGDTHLVEDGRTYMRIQPVGANKFLVVLELDDVIESDAGLYKVKAKNKMGEVAASINLNFSPADEPRERQIDGIAPTFAKKPAIRQEEDGKRLLFECRIQADPKPTVTWFHSGVLVQDSARHKLTVDKDGHSYFATLEIQNVTVEDAGKYKVTAKNELGESNATISLNFDSGDDAGFAPSFVEKPKIIPNDQGTLITMKCKCKAKPKPTVTWYRGTTAVSETSKIKIRTVDLEEDVYELTLEIKDPVGADGGTYRCHVKNEYGESNANLNLNIEAEAEVEGDGPSFVVKPKIVSERNGKLVIMDFTVKADPKPSITWYHEGKEVKETSKIKMSMIQTKDVYYIKLELTDPGPEDSGLYKCMIKNSLGELISNLTLNIEIVPVIREKPKVIKIVKKRTVVVECHVQSQFAPQCTWFKEKSAVREDSRHFVRVEQVREGEFAVKLEIESVQITDKGSYKLVAKNDKGEATSQVVEVVDIPVEEEEKKPKGEKPKIAQGLKAVSCEEGKSAEFVCQLSSVDKKATVTWYKSTQVIKESREMSMSFDGTYARLNISSCKTEYSGSYKIVISNEFGKDESSAELKIAAAKKKEVEKKEEKKEEVKVEKKEEKKMEVKVEKKEEVKVEQKSEVKVEQREEIRVETKKVEVKMQKKEEAKVEVKQVEQKAEVKVEKKEETKVEAKRVENKTEVKVEKKEEAKKVELKKVEQKKVEEVKINDAVKLKPVEPKEQKAPALNGGENYNDKTPTQNAKPTETPEADIKPFEPKKLNKIEDQKDLEPLKKPTHLKQEPVKIEEEQKAETPKKTFGQKYEPQKTFGVGGEQVKLSPLKRNTAKQEKEPVKIEEEIKMEPQKKPLFGQKQEPQKTFGVGGEQVKLSPLKRNAAKQEPPKIEEEKKLEVTQKKSIGGKQESQKTFGVGGEQVKLSPLKRNAAKQEPPKTEEPPKLEPLKPTPAKPEVPKKEEPAPKAAAPKKEEAPKLRKYDPMAFYDEEEEDEEEEEEEESEKKKTEIPVVEETVVSPEPPAEKPPAPWQVRAFNSGQTLGVLSPSHSCYW